MFSGDLNWFLWLLWVYEGKGVWIHKVFWTLVRMLLFSISMFFSRPGQSLCSIVVVHLPRFIHRAWNEFSLTSESEFLARLARPGCGSWTLSVSVTLVMWVQVEPRLRHTRPDQDHDCGSCWMSGCRPRVLRSAAKYWTKEIFCINYLFQYFVIQTELHSQCVSFKASV